MSRIGKQPIIIPDGVAVSITDSTLYCKGPKGDRQLPVPSLVNASIEGDRIMVKRNNDSARTKAFHGLWRSLIANAIIGVSGGFEKILELKGVGYRAVVEGNTLTLWLGFSHPIVYQLPEGITTNIEKNTIIKIQGINKEQVGQVAAYIRRFRPVEPYKGRGIRYRDEIVIKKAGKSAKTST